MSRVSGYHLEAVTKSYGGQPVLHVDRLEIAAGEVLCLVGPTGAGKSTLLRLLAGLEAPTAGMLRLGEHLLNGNRLPLEVQRRLTLVFQRPLVLAGSVRANVAYGLRLRGRSRDAEGVRAAVDLLGLSPLAERVARTLSGGEMQMVALARALVIEPDVLLLDEPTNNLDPARVALVEQAVVADHRRRATTTVWATHNLFQARRVATRVALLLNGRLVEVAPTEKFFDEPDDPRTAAFVRGEMIY
jgi:tungstate transport system ATP-binding protein